MRGLFQVSFDGALRPRQWRSAWIGAAAISAVAIAVAIVGGIELLRSNSDNLSSMVNSPAPKVRVLGGETTPEQPCDEQTWPYIEARCLSVAKPGTGQVRTTARHGLSGEVALPARRPPLAERARETTGTASPTVRTSDPNATADNVPLPPSRPRGLAALAEPATAASAVGDGPPKTRSERRRAPATLQRDRAGNDSGIARNGRRAAQRARAASPRGDNGRIVRSWTEYTYESPSGRSRKIIVIRRGSLDDDFFRTIR